MDNNIGREGRREGVANFDLHTQFIKHMSIVEIQTPLVDKLRFTIMYI